MNAVAGTASLIAPARFVRRTGRKDRGESVTEVIVAMALLFTLITGFSLSFFKASSVQRISVNETVADEAAAAFIEQARSKPWSEVGTATLDTSLLPTGMTVVKGGTLPATSTVTVRGREITLRTSIGWRNTPGTTSYGVKSVLIDASWQDRAGDPATTHTIRQETILTPGVDQAAPSGVRGGS